MKLLAMIISQYLFIYISNILLRYFFILVIIFPLLIIILVVEIKGTNGVNCGMHVSVNSIQRVGNAIYDQSTFAFIPFLFNNLVTY